MVTLSKKGKKWSVYLKIDAGYSRAGIASDNLELILKIGKLLSAHDEIIQFQGWHTKLKKDFNLIQDVNFIS